MKKIVAFLVLILSLVTMTACTSAFSNTKVRVVALSFSTSNTESAMKPEKNQIKLLSNKLLADEVEEYIFPGDILTFTVELEDPNFEFISLLSIKINEKVMRANVDNSIVITRDCGVNICIDFPFELTETKQYTIQEVKFAKLNSDGGINARIDNSSIDTITINVYDNDIYPYVLESVDELNRAFQSMSFYEDGHTFDAFSDPNALVFDDALYYSRTFYIDNYEETEHFSRAISSYATYDLLNSQGHSIVEADTWMFYDNFTFQNETRQQTIKQYIVVQYVGEQVDARYHYVAGMFFYLQHVRYKDTYFYNEGNKIYVNLLGANIYLIEL